MLSILDRAVTVYAGLGLKLLALGKKYVVAYWVFQLSGLGLLIYVYGFWYTVGCILLPLNVLGALMLWRANQVDNQHSWYKN